MSPVNGSLTAEWLQAQQKAFNESPTRVLAQNAMVNAEMPKVLTKRGLVSSYNHNFSVKVPIEGKCTNQQSTGRCWLFAATNMMRLQIMKDHNLGDDFELSQAYLFFFDKLERINFLFENILDTMNEETDSRLIQHLLFNPLEDGGQFDMFINVVEKYGVVPKDIFPENITTKSSAAMNWMLSKKVREYACRLRGCYYDNGANEKAMLKCRELKSQFMSEVFAVLSIHFGPIPETFDWTFQTKDKEFKRVANLTPQTFYREHTGVSVKDYISLIHDPRNAYETAYTVDRLGNTMDGLRIRYINVDVETLQRYTYNRLKQGQSVWFGCDVNQEHNRDLGVMDTDVFDYDLVYGEGVAPYMNKADRLRYKASMMTHAMLFTGCDVPDGANEEALPTKYRVENSWGDKLGDKGYHIMTADWFKEFVYQIVVHKSELSDTLTGQLTSEPTVLPPWDPMGTLA
eukprot:CFRG7511T1